MSTTTTPKFIQNTFLAGSLATPQVVTKGGLARGTLDLTNQFGAWLMVSVGKGGTSAFNSGLTIAISPALAQAGPSTKVHTNSNLNRTSNTTTCNGASTCATSDSSAGQNVLTLGSSSGFAAGDLICVQDAGGGVTRLEFARVSKVSGQTLVLRSNLQYTHTAAAADTVRNQADVFPRMWVAGGDTVEVVADYGAELTGDPMTVQVVATLYSSDITA